MTEEAAAAEEPVDGPAEAGADEEPPGQYWLRVHGYPIDIGDEWIQYGDFYDPRTGPLEGDPSTLLQPGDMIVFYADGPASLYAVGRVAGPVERAPTASHGAGWRVAVTPQSVIPIMNKAAHAAGLKPPSGWSFLTAVRAYTFIRIPSEDGPYLVEQVKSRASTKGD